MLDDLKYIHEKDHQDALGEVEKQAKQLKHQFGVTLRPSNEVKNIVLAGMGGSAWPASFVQVWPSTKVPLEISRDYQLPKYVDGQSLVIISSYSGNTEETIASLADAEEKMANIVVITNGGQLAELAEEKNLPLFKLPDVLQPRMSAFYFWAALVELFENLGLVEAGSKAKLDNAGDWLSGQVAEWLPTVPTSKNQAKQIAQELMGKSITIYSGPKLFPAANKWRISFNENSKNLAWANQYPEFSHNEFISWSGQPTNKLFAVVEIQSNLEHERIQKRFAITERLLSGQRPSPIIVNPNGASVLEQIVWSSALGDFVSIYLALLNGVDPTPVELVEKLKKALSDEN